MQASEPSIKRQTESSFKDSYNNTDFKPPEHSYIVTDQFNSAFFRDHNEEQYQIQRAFKPSNFTSLRTNIPNQLKYGSILDDRLNKVQQNIDAEALNRRKTPSEKEEQLKSRIAKRKMQQIGQLGYFQVFPYQQSLYGLEHDLKLREMYQSKRKQESISTLDFRPAGFDKKLKYENPFSYVDKIEGHTIQKEEYLFPFHIPEDTYDSFHYSELRRRIIQQGAKIAGQFIPASNQKSLSKITRSKASQILKQLEQYLKRYLSELPFFIGMNKRDHIDILFQENEAQNAKLHYVMSRLCQHQMMSKYILRRNIWKWARMGDSGYFQYCVLPPWVKDPEEKLNRQ